MYKLLKISAFFAIILPVFFSCCQNSDLKQPDTIYVNLDDPREELTPIIIPDTLFSDALYIPLETTDESVFYEISKLDIKQDHIYILDTKQDVILVFDCSGKFLKKLSRKGQGPEEYISIDDFVVADSLLYILSQDNRKVVVYDTDFNFVRSYNINTHASYMEKKGRYLFIYTVSSPDLKNIYVLDLESGEIKSKFFDFLEKQRGVGYGGSYFAINKDTLFMTFPYDYKIYTVDSLGYKEYKNVDFGKGNMFPPDWKNLSHDERDVKIKNTYPDFIDRPVPKIDNIYISDHYLFFTFIYRISELKYIMNRTTGKSIVGYIAFSEQFPFTNSHFITVIDDKMIFYIYSDNMNISIEALKMRNKNYTFPDNFYKDIELDDNPVICIHTLKF